jgi:hypothetical protein
MAGWRGGSRDAGLVRDVLAARAVIRRLWCYYQRQRERGDVNEEVAEQIKKGFLHTGKVRSVNARPGFYERKGLNLIDTICATGSCPVGKHSEIVTTIRLKRAA